MHVRDRKKFWENPHLLENLVCGSTEVIEKKKTDAICVSKKILTFKISRK